MKSYQQIAVIAGLLALSSACGQALDLRSAHIQPGQNTSSPALNGNGTTAAKQEVFNVVNTRVDPTTGGAHIFFGTGPATELCDDLIAGRAEPHATQIHALVGNSNESPLAPGVYPARDLGFKAPPANTNIAAISGVSLDGFCRYAGDPNAAEGTMLSVTIQSVDSNGITGSYDWVNNANQHTIVPFKSVSCGNGNVSPYEYGGTGGAGSGVCQERTGISAPTDRVQSGGNYMDVYLSDTANLCDALNQDQAVPNTAQLHIRFGTPGGAAAQAGTYTTRALGFDQSPPASNIAAVTLSYRDATCGETGGTNYVADGGNIIITKVDANGVSGSYNITLLPAGETMAGTFSTTTCAFNNSYVVSEWGSTGYPLGTCRK